MVGESNHSAPKTAPTLHLDAYAHAISWSGNANFNQSSLPAPQMIYGVHSLILKRMVMVKHNSEALYHIAFDL